MLFRFQPTSQLSALITRIKSTKTEAGKIKAIVAATKEFHDEGRPVLIGSASIAKNELISSALDKAGLPHETLNAKKQRTRGRDYR